MNLLVDFVVVRVNVECNVWNSSFVCDLVLCARAAWKDLNWSNLCCSYIPPTSLEYINSLTNQMYVFFIFILISHVSLQWKWFVFENISTNILKFVSLVEFEKGDRYYILYPNSLTRYSKIYFFKTKFHLKNNKKYNFYNLKI